MPGEQLKKDETNREEGFNEKGTQRGGRWREGELINGRGREGKLIKGGGREGA